MEAFCDTGRGDEDKGHDDDYERGRQDGDKVEVQVGDCIGFEGVRYGEIEDREGVVVRREFVEAVADETKGTVEHLVQNYQRDVWFRERTRAR